MERPDSSLKTHNPAGVERRVHVRHPISIPVNIIIDGLGKRSAEARDFCMGGLLIIFQDKKDLASDKSIDNSICLITLDLNGDEHRLRARIVRVGDENIGVSFLNPDKMVLQAIQKHAEVDAQPSMPSTPHGERNKATPIVNDSQTKNSSIKELNVSAEQFSKIRNACNRKVLEKIQPLLRSFSMELSDNLFERAKEETIVSRQNILFKTLERINNNKSIINTSFSNSINTSINNNQTLSVDADGNAEDEKSYASLELIDDDEFNAWLASSKIINKVESEFPMLLGEVERRLGYIYGENIDRRNNPYSPALFVDAFQDAIESIEIENTVKPDFYDSFGKVFVPVSEKLYTEINTLLIDENILPGRKDIIEYARKIMGHNDKLEENTDEDKSNEQDGVSESLPDINENKNETSSDDGKHILNREQKTQRKEVCSRTGGEDNSNEKHNLYELVGEIRELQQQLRSSQGFNPTARQDSHSGESNNSGTISNSSFNESKLPAYSTAEVLDVIANIKVPKNSAKGDGNSIAEFRQALDVKLTDNEGNENGKSLSLQQGRVIDITENVFTALLNDLQVAESVRPWLEQLALPIMKVALLDENIFTDKDHVVREVVNKLANLEVLASADDEDEQAAVRQAFNWIIDTVNNEFDGTTSVYTRAAKQLDLLINIQQQAFEKNIQHVVAEAVKDETDPADDETTVSNTEKKSDDSEETDVTDRWIRMVQRLKENHWVLFDVDTDDAKRLKVAWIATYKGKYVFVNVMGRKDRIVTDAELAKSFANGSAVVLDDTDDPAMDRAQYSMLQNLHKQLIFQSTHDELTGLINRREFLISMQLALDDARLSKNKHTICFIDIDDFKIANTSYGYDAGDKLLLESVELISKSLDENNVVARLGSDQFALLLQNTSIDDGVEIIEDIMDKFDDYRFEWEDNRLSITISAGLAIINASTIDTTELLQSVESSCSLAKESGGNQVQIAHLGSSRLSKRKKEMEWVSKIDKAIDEDGLYLRCQKIAPANSYLDLPAHYEILLGISDELGGQGSLGDFIQAAEHHNKMQAVDRWVIKTAFRWLSENEDAVSDISSFSINLSGQSLNNDQIVEFVYQQAYESSVSIEKVCFEVTETTGVTSLSDSADFIETIKETGCKFSLDDFGTGMSSYSYLKNLPVDYLKIDGVFIKDIVNNKNDYAVVKSICEIGHFMGKKVIAEFVQDEESSEILREIGIDYLQGYGIAKPHNLDDLLK